MIKHIIIMAAIIMALFMAPVAGISGDKININTAGAEQLVTLPGIGPALAERIIEHRDEFPFETIEDIMQVSGIGEVRFDEIKDMITVE